MNVVAVVLAAGQGSRFGADKRCAPLADGRGLLAHSVANAWAVFAEVRVVLREGERPEAFGLPGDCRVVYSPDAALGMGSSLASGVASLADSTAQAVAILLGDMPWIAPTTLEQLADAATRSTILFPCHQGRQGHPVIFGCAFWPELGRLTGDQGARAVVQARRHQCVGLAVDDPGVLRDVDTAQQLISAAPQPWPHRNRPG